MQRADAIGASQDEKGFEERSLSSQLKVLIIDRNTYKYESKIEAFSYV